MPTLILIVLIGALFAMGGIITWLINLLFGRKGRGRRIARVTTVSWLISLPVLILVCLPLLAAWLVSQASTRPDERNLNSLPSDFGADFEAVRFASRDAGLQLSGWWLPGTRNAPPLVFGHGLFRSRREVVERCCDLNRHGVSCLVFDFRSHGESAAAPITLGYRERLDFLGAIDFALEKSRSEQVIVGGVSMGAVAGLLAAANEPERVAGVLADSPFLSLHSTADRHTWLFLRLPAFPFARLFGWNLARLGGFSPEDLDLDPAFPRLASLPILLIYGREDTRMPPEEAEEIFRRLPSSRKQLIYIEGAGHGAGYAKDKSGYLKVVRSFIDSPGNLGSLGAVMAPDAPPPND